MSTLPDAYMPFKSKGSNWIPCLTPVEIEEIRAVWESHLESRAARPSAGFEDIWVHLPGYHVIVHPNGLAEFSKGREEFSINVDDLEKISSSPDPSNRPWLSPLAAEEARDWAAEAMTSPAPSTLQVNGLDGKIYRLSIDSPKGLVVFSTPGQGDYVTSPSALEGLTKGPSSPVAAKVVKKGKNPYEKIEAYRRLLELRGELQNVFLGKNMNEATAVSLVGLLSQSNVFLGGPPGTGKTSLIKTLGDATGLRFRKRLAGMETTSRDLFGPIDAKRYAEGEAYERMTDNTFSDAEFSFLDEGFKASKQALQLLLDYYEDGEIDNGSGRLQTPHLFGVIASNELAPKGSEALLDRFPLRCWGDAQLDQNEELELMRRSINPARLTVQTRLLGEDLTELRQLAKRIPITGEGFSAVQCAIEMARNAGVYFSARQIAGVMPILQTVALLWGDAEVTAKQACFLRFFGWTNDDQRRAMDNAATIASTTNTKKVEDYSF